MCVIITIESIKGIKMKIELTEEEREWLERVCRKAYKFADMGVWTTDLNRDKEQLTKLMEKLKKNDS